MLKSRFSCPLKTKLLSLFLIVISINSYTTEIQKWTGLTNQPEQKTKYFLHTGFMFDAVLRTAIFSFNIESPVIAEVEYDVIFLDKVMIPKKTKLIGYASVLKAADRVIVFFHTIVFPDGSEIKFSGLALHTDGSLGLPGKVKRHKEAVPARILLETAANIALPGVGGAIIRGLTTEELKEIEKYRPTYSISVKKDTPFIVFNTARIEY